MKLRLHSASAIALVQTIALFFSIAASGFAQSNSATQTQIVQTHLPAHSNKPPSFQIRREEFFAPYQEAVTGLYDIIKGYLSKEQSTNLVGLTNVLIDMNDLTPFSFSTITKMDGSGTTISLSLGGVVSLHYIAYAFVISTEMLKDPSFFMDYCLFIRNILPDGPIPDPFEALGWKPSDLGPNFQVKIALHATDTLLFIIGHEVGHVVLKHKAIPPYAKDDELAKSRRQEEDADTFSLDLLAESQTSPVPTMVLFLAWVMTNQGVDSPIGSGTHPADYARLSAAVNHLVNNLDKNGLQMKRKEIELLKTQFEKSTNGLGKNAPYPAINEYSKKLALDRLKRKLPRNIAP